MAIKPSSVSTFTLTLALDPNTQILDRLLVSKGVQNCPLSSREYWQRVEINLWYWCIIFFSIALIEGLDSSSGNIFPDYFQLLTFQSEMNNFHFNVKFLACNRFTWIGNGCDEAVDSTVCVYSKSITRFRDIQRNGQRISDSDYMTLNQIALLFANEMQVSRVASAICQRQFHLVEYKMEISNVGCVFEQK